MATVINNPTPMVDRSETVDSRSGAGFVLGVLAAIILGILLLAYVVPGLRTGRGNTVNVPSASTSGTVSGSGSSAQ